MKGVIFDLDGTLTNSIGDIAASINYARRCFDGEPVSEDKVQAVVGQGLMNALNRVIDKYGPALRDENELNLMYQIVVKYYENHPADHSYPYPGVIELLKTLKKNGIKVAILSNKDKKVVDSVLPAVFPDFSFDAVVGSGAGIPKKPNKEALIYTLALMNLKKEECVYVGDIETDYTFAVASGIKHLIVTYGFRSRKLLEEAGASPLCDHVPTLAELESL